MSDGICSITAPNSAPIRHLDEEGKELDLYRIVMCFSIIDSVSSGKYESSQIISAAPAVVVYKSSPVSIPIVQMIASDKEALKEKLGTIVDQMFEAFEKTK